MYSVSKFSWLWYHFVINSKSEEAKKIAKLSTSSSEVLWFYIEMISMKETVPKSFLKRQLGVLSHFTSCKIYLLNPNIDKLQCTEILVWTFVYLEKANWSQELFFVSTAISKLWWIDLGQLPDTHPAALSLPLLNWTRDRIRWKTSKRNAGRLLTNCCHSQNRLVLGKNNLMYCQK